MGIQLKGTIIFAKQSVCLERPAADTRTLIAEFDVFLTVHLSIELFNLPTLMHNSLFINTMCVTLQSLTCFEH
jgi:hypothetical protein